VHDPYSVEFSGKAFNAASLTAHAQRLVKEMEGLAAGP
jgi:hypothetical protein